MIEEGIKRKTYKKIYCFFFLKDKRASHQIQRSKSSHLGQSHTRHAKKAAQTKSRSEKFLLNDGLGQTWPSNGDRFVAVC